ncbi:class IV adenylate cyclase [Candidatus Woesearchaeota archaeon]|nr:class IV adenylate cyclase [Candidatus Woesearchaeota archaeon]
MIEVEIKARIKDIRAIKTQLDQLGAERIKTLKQVDKVLLHPDFLDHEGKVIEGGVVSRIRTVDGRHCFEMKEIRRKAGGIEIKSDVSSPEAVVAILEKLGFREEFTVRKQRTKYTYNGFTIALDDVDTLGHFIEIEKILDNKDSEESVMQACRELLEAITKDYEIEDQKYGDLIIEKMNEASKK